MNTLRTVRDRLRETVAIPLATISNLRFEIRLMVWFIVIANLLLVLGAIAHKTMPKEYREGFAQPFTLVNPR